MRIKKLIPFFLLPFYRIGLVDKSTNPATEMEQIEFFGQSGGEKLNNFLHNECTEVIELSFHERDKVCDF